jgi:hypothetical protein
MIQYPRKLITLKGIFVEVYDEEHGVIDIVSLVPNEDGAKLSLANIFRQLHGKNLTISVCSAQNYRKEGADIVMLNSGMYAGILLSKNKNGNYVGGGLEELIFVQSVDYVDGELKVATLNLSEIVPRFNLCGKLKSHIYILGNHIDAADLETLIEHFN